MTDSTGELYDPADSENLVKNVVREFLERPRLPLPPVEGANAPGVYALYYEGDFEGYGPLRGRDTPIYVGKALPKGRRTGMEVVESGSPLRDRLREHARSIEQAKNLRLSDFKCRFLATKVIWIDAVEELLIKRYRPLWNSVVAGFGIHHPGMKGRGNQRRSMWDTIHPGRPWAAQLPPNEMSEREILESIRKAL